MNLYFYRITLVAAMLLAAGCSTQHLADDLLPATNERSPDMSEAVLGAGCFWCLEAAYEEIDGVHEVISGYAGGSEAAPTYNKVSRGQTTHAEVIKVVYNPNVVTYRELIDFFWSTHDASRSDGVWPDFGPQYRSILLYKNDTESTVIQASKTAQEAIAGQIIATEIKAFDIFYPAENYHQNYADKNPNDRYVRGILEPKMKKLGLAQ